MIIFQAVCGAIILTGLALTAYWLIGAALWDRATDRYFEACQAYLRGDIMTGNRLRSEGDRLEAIARRWSVGAGGRR